MAKYVLDNVFDYDFSLIAITSSEPDYKICIHLNRQLNLGLIREADVDLKAKNMKAPLTFACFRYEDEENFHEYVLLSNRSINSISTAEKTPSTPSLFDEESPADIKGYLVPELAQYDFLLLLKGESHETLARMVQPELKKIIFVQAITVVDLETLASKKNLLI
jgi:hypothetical protein